MLQFASNIGFIVLLKLIAGSQVFEVLSTDLEVQKK
jgi:hypothetical protein